MRKLFKNVLMIFMVTCMSLPTYIHANSDTQSSNIDITPPVLKSVNVDKNRIEAGESITFTIDATDDKSGLESVYISLKMPLSNKAKSIRCEQNNNGSYIGIFQSNNEMENGIWKIDYIELTDNNDNSIINFNKTMYPKYKNIFDYDSCNFELYGSGDVDVTPPVLNSVSVDKNRIEAGNSITFTVDATDDKSGIKSISIFLKMPLTNKEVMISCEQNSDGKYVGYFQSDNEMENGIWIIDCILLWDNEDNKILNCNKTVYPKYTNIFDYDNCNFELYGSSDADITPPVLNSVSVDKNRIEAGNSITFTVDATDDKSGIQQLDIELKTPLTNKNVTITCEQNNDGKYIGYFQSDDEIESGKWEINYIYLKDNKNNVDFIYNKKFYPTLADAIDLDNCVFELVPDTSSIKPMGGVTVLNRSETITGKTFEGDVYIADNAVVTLNLCTVKGNIYVVGALYFRSSKTSGNIYCTTAYLSGNPPVLYPGTLIVSGFTTIPTISAGNKPVKEVPIRFDNSLYVKANGKIDLFGATINIGEDLIINGVKVALDFRNRFDIKDFYVGENDVLKIERKIGLGYTVVQEVSLTHEKPITLEIINEPNKKVYNYGDTFDKTGLKVNAVYQNGYKKDVSDYVKVGELTTLGKVNVPVTYRGVSSTIPLTINEILAESVTLNETNKLVKVGDTFSLSGTVLPANTTNKTLQWKSSNENIATVDKNGNVKALAKGSVDITVQTANGKKASCKIVVKPEVQNITLSHNSLDMTYGRQAKITATVSPSDVYDSTLQWSSSNEFVAQVNNNGNITAVTEGGATITVTSVNGVVATCNIYVYPKANYIDLNIEGTNNRIDVGVEKQLIAEVHPYDTIDKEVVWESSDPKTISVNQSGKIRSLTAGKVKIRASLKSDKTVYSEIIITAYSNDGWSKKGNGEWEYYQYGEPVDGWQAIDGLQYYFRNEEMVHDWFLDENTQTWYFFNGGVMQRSDIEINGVTYKFDKDGIWRGYKPRWVWYNNNYYYKDEWNNDVKGWQAIDGLQYMFREDGTMIRDWYLDENTQTWYFFNGGVMQRTNMMINGKLNLFDNYGIWRGVAPN